MNMLLALVVSASIGAQIPSDDRQIGSQLPLEGVDYVVLSRLDASGIGQMLQGLFDQLKMKPSYRLAVYPLPGETKPRLLFIKGREADVALVKKIVGAMETAAEGGAEMPAVLRLESKSVSAAEMRKRLLDSFSRAGIPLREADLLLYPAGAAGSLFFIGSQELSARVAEMSKGLDRETPPGRTDLAKAYARQLCDETVKAFGTLFSTALSAVILIVLHSILSRLPFVGKRYRRSFKLFWEKLFASFKGKDLAWEIIKAAAELGVASAGVVGPAAPREAVGGAASAALGPEKKARAMAVACAYARYRGVDPDRPEMRKLLEAAVDAAASTAVRSEKKG